MMLCDAGAVVMLRNVVICNAACDDDVIDDDDGVHQLQCCDAVML